MSYNYGIDFFIDANSESDNYTVLITIGDSSFYCDEYFATEEDAQAFIDEKAALLSFYRLR